MTWLRQALQQVLSAFGLGEAGSSTQECPLKSTLLAVIVTSEAGEECIPGVTVEIKGPSPGSKSTDQDGIAIFRPVKPGQYQVHVKLTGKAEGKYEKPAPENTSVSLGDLAACVVRLRPLASLRVRVVGVSKDPDGVECETILDGVTLKVSGRDTREGKTPSAPGWFRAERLRSGDYSVRVTSFGAHAGAYAIPESAAVTLAPGDTLDLVLRTTQLARLRIVLIDRADKPISGKAWELLSPVKASGTTGSKGLIEAANLPVARAAGVLRVDMGVPRAARASPEPAPAAAAAGTPPPYPPPIAAREFTDPAPPTPQTAADAGIVEWSLTLDDPKAYDNDPGIKSRLHNLGFGCAPSSDEKTTARAVKAYQARYLKQAAGSGKLADVKADVTKRHDVV